MPERIVVGIDGSPNARAALPWAVREAKGHGARIEAVHVWHPPYRSGAYGGKPLSVGPFEEDAEQILDEAIGSVDARGLPKPISRVTACGMPARTRTGIAAGAALLVVGRSGLAAGRKRS